MTFKCDNRGHLAEEVPACSRACSWWQCPPALLFLVQLTFLEHLSLRLPQLSHPWATGRSWSLIHPSRPPLPTQTPLPRPPVAGCKLSLTGASALTWLHFPGLPRRFSRPSPSLPSLLSFTSAAVFRLVCGGGRRGDQWQRGRPKGVSPNMPQIPFRITLLTSKHHFCLQLILDTPWRSRS